jgi:hypothetical protein
LLLGYRFGERTAACIRTGFLSCALSLPAARGTTDVEGAANSELADELAATTAGAHSSTPHVAASPAYCYAPGR